MSDYDSSLPPALSANSSTDMSKLFGCFMFLFGFLFSSIFFVVGSAMFYLMGLSPWMSVLSAQSWQETPCVILAPEAGGPKLRYSYDINGREFIGTEYSFDKMNGGLPAENDLRREFPVGANTVCYVDPGDLSNAVLHRGFVAGMLWGLFPIPFLLVGLIGYIVLFFAVRNRKSIGSGLSPSLANLSSRGETGGPDRPSMRASSVTAVQTVSNSDFDDEDLIDESGPVTLTVESSPLGKFIGTLIFAVIWNSIVGVFVFLIGSEWMNGKGEWFPTLFMIPFVLIGLGVIGAAVYFFLATFNPTPVMTMSRRLIPLAGTADLNWEFAGNTRSIRNLRIVLKGVEEARYTRGTDTYTDTETFYEEDVFNATDPTEIEVGSAELTIPGDTMHSFSASNNKIKWSLEVQGDIPLWPDVHAVFPIRVVPHE
ncbi:MAG: DUF3592 domain-containing protein [Planctomycetaceae bacterium]|nr:DUF3592 domain-containing protein [Planctomycetaceae bacterium]